MKLLHHCNTLYQHQKKMSTENLLFFLFPAMQFLGDLLAPLSDAPVQLWLVGL